MTQNEIECPKCHKPLLTRHGKNGDFYGCSGYPNCDFTSKMSTEPKKSYPEAPKSESKGYHLTPEQIRTNALDAAFTFFGNSGFEGLDFWKKVQEFEKYIEDGTH